VSVCRNGDLIHFPFAEILETPVVNEPVALEKKVISYAMVDPKLEELSLAQKHFFRMGPENLQIVQTKLREIALALGLAENELPKPVVYQSGRR
jgi:exosome complex RNA-binding protein Rrp42 (RNase PH superfamily)